MVPETCESGEDSFRVSAGALGAVVSIFASAEAEDGEDWLATLSLIVYR